MMHRSVAWRTLSSFIGGLALLASSGCADNQIGRRCNNPSSPVTNGVTFVNPAPDCPSRLCMITPKSTSGQALEAHKSAELSICTAECNTDDDCNSGYTGGANPTCSKFVCAVASVVPGEENFCCKKICMCNADLQPGFNTNGTGARLENDEFGVPIPTACRRANACQLN